MAQAFKTVDVLRLEVEDDPTGLVNLVQNPNGELGGWGWISPVSGSLVTNFHAAPGWRLRYTYPPGANFFTTEPMPIAAGEYAAAFALGGSGGVGQFRLRFEWLDASGAVISSSAQSSYFSVNTVPMSLSATVAPASTVAVRLRFDLYANTSGANPALGGFVTFLNVTVAKAATSAELVTVRTNLVVNPSFETNTSNWESNAAFGVYTPAALARSTTRAQSGAASLLATWPTGVRSWVNAYAITGLTTGATYTASSYVWVPTGSPDPRMEVAFGANGARTSVKNAWQRISLTFTAPGPAVFIGVQVDSPSAGQQCWVDSVLVERADAVDAYFDGGTVLAGHTFAWTGSANASPSTDTSTALAFIEPVPYLNVLGPTHDIKITRDELDVGLLTATILDAALDPAKAELLRPGRRVRATALDPDSGEWTPLFFGKAQNAKVTYDYKTAAVPDAKRARITLVAVDNVAAVAAVPREEGVSELAELPYLLEGAGVPWNVNGSGSQAASATVVARNPNAYLLDQIAISRDSALGYAWVDRHGVVQAWDSAEMTTTAAAVFTESNYTDLVIDYDTERCINTVSLTYLRFNLVSGETVEVPYGPYVDTASRKQWGPLSAEFTIQGGIESDADMAAFAASVLAANSTPTVRINSVTLAVLTAEQVAYALRDLYDLVEVDNADADLDDELRITGVEHTITPDKWLTTYSFAADGGVAPPQSTPSPRTNAGDTNGWLALTHEGSSGTLQCKVVNGVVYVEGNNIAIAIPNNTTTPLLASGNAIPVERRPGSSLTMHCGSVDVGTFGARVTRNSDGTITVRHNQGSAAASISFVYSYPLG